MTTRRWVVLLAAAVAVLLLAGRLVATIYADYRFYSALGAASLWRVRAVALLATDGLSRLIAALFVFANLYAVRQSVVSLVLPRRVGNIEIGEEVPGRYLVVIAALLAAALGAVLPLPGGSWWRFVLPLFGTPFGESDPYLDADLGSYVYRFPLESTLYLWVLIALLVVTAVVIFLYALTPSLRWERGRLYVSNYVRRHLVVLGALLLLVVAWSYRLDEIRVMLSGSGPDGAFTYADHHAVIPVDLALSVLMLVAATAVLWFGWTGQVRIAFGAVSAVLLLGIGLRQVAPLVVRGNAPARDPAARERPYLITRAEYTRHAFALDQVAWADGSVGYASLREAAPNVSAWDPGALRHSLSRARRGELNADAVGWGGSPLGLLALVPQRSARSVLSGEPNWSLSRLLASSSDAQGDPVHVGPTGLRVREDQHLEPVIIADSSSGYTVVADSLGRIAAPTVASFGSRLAFAWSLQNFRLLFGDLPQPLPRIVTHRDVRDRVRALAPFFLQGSDVLPLALGDSLFWALDLYSSSDSYPLSATAVVADQQVNYLQHAATAIVDAHTGRVVLAVDSVLDPIARSWTAAFPSLFTAWSRLAPAMAERLPPALDAARAQAALIARFGMRGEPDRNGHVPWVTGADSALIDAGTALFTLPERPAPLAWAQAVLDENDHTVGLVIATGGPAHESYWMPLPAPGVRWTAASDQLHRATDSITTPPDGGQVVRGALRAIPVAGGVAYVQSSYAWRSDAPPELLDVATLTDTGTITAGRTLVEAVGLRPPERIDSLGAPGSADIRRRVAALVERMRTALRRGDWVAFGAAFDALAALTGSAHAP